MKPIHVAGLAVAGIGLVAGAVALAARARRPVARGGAAPTDARASAAADDPVVAPAYAYLDRWTSDERRALHDLQVELGLDPRVGGLAGVIGHESGGDPTVPTKQDRTPRGGLIQVTLGARVPGYDTADKVWAIRGQDRITQLRGVVRDYYKRMLPQGPPADQTAAALLRRNYLSGWASKPAATVLGVRPGGVGPGGEKPEDHISPDLTLGGNYASNPGFDPAGRGWFTWEDVDRQAVKAERAALARGWVRASGARVQPGDLPIAGFVQDATPHLADLRGGSASGSELYDGTVQSDRLTHHYRIHGGRTLTVDSELLPERRGFLDADAQHVTGAIVHLPKNDEEVAYIGRIDTFKGKGKGYGPEAMSIVESLLHKRGVGRVCAYVEHDNYASRRMFEKLGYHVVEEKPDGNMMAKDLPIGVVKSSETSWIVSVVQGDATNIWHVRLDSGETGKLLRVTEPHIGEVVHVPLEVVSTKSCSDGQLRAAKEKLRGILGRPPWLTGGIGIGNSEVIVGVRELTDDVQRLVPASIDGVPVRVDAIGDAYALQAECHHIAGVVNAEPETLDDEGVFWHPWRYPPGTKMTAGAAARVAEGAEAARVEREARGESILDSVLRLCREGADRRAVSVAGCVLLGTVPRLRSMCEVLAVVGEYRARCGSAADGNIELLGTIDPADLVGIDPSAVTVVGLRPGADPGKLWDVLRQARELGLRAPVRSLVGNPPVPPDLVDAPVAGASVTGLWK